MKRLFAAFLLVLASAACSNPTEPVGGDEPVEGHNGTTSTFEGDDEAAIAARFAILADAFSSEDSQTYWENMRPYCRNRQPPIVTEAVLTQARTRMGAGGRPINYTLTDIDVFEENGVPRATVTYTVEWTLPSGATTSQVGEDVFTFEDGEWWGGCI